MHDDVQRLITLLGLEPHPEGGYFRETWRHRPADGARGAGTAIYFLITADVHNRWHRVDAAEIWHWYGGAPMELHLRDGDAAAEMRILGPDLFGGQRPQLEVPPGWWQRARTQGEFTLVGCTVSPAFDFKYFEIAPA